MAQDVKFEHSKTDDLEDDEYDNDGSINSTVEGDDDIKRNDDYDATTTAMTAATATTSAWSNIGTAAARSTWKMNLWAEPSRPASKRRNSSSTCSLAWRLWPPARPPIITCGGTSETGSLTRYVFVRSFVWIYPLLNGLDVIYVVHTCCALLARFFSPPGVSVVLPSRFSVVVAAWSRNKPKPFSRHATRLLPTATAAPLPR